jgi:hypothetical protein
MVMKLLSGVYVAEMKKLSSVLENVLVALSLR